MKTVTGHSCIKRESVRYRIDRVILKESEDSFEFYLLTFTK